MFSCTHSCCAALTVLHLIRYLGERKQFGVPLAAFQLNQEKLVRMLGNIQAMWLLGWRLCKLHSSSKMTIGQASLGKVSWWLRATHSSFNFVGAELIEKLTAKNLYCNIWTSFSSKKNIWTSQ